MRDYARTEDVFAIVADFHRRLSKIYKRLSGRADQQRVKLLLGYLQRHEQRFAQALEEYDTQAREKIKNTWYQYVPDEETLSTEGIEIEDDMDIDQVTKIAMELDERLIRFFERMANNVGAPYETREVFQAMIEQEKQEKAELIQSAEDLKKL